jgi:hypothetical protein
MSKQTVPLVILGGSDRKPPKLPPKGRDKHPLSGCKGVDLRIGGHPLIELLAQRLEASGEFGPIYLAGPAAVYRVANLRLPVIDTDAGFGKNIQVAVEELLTKHPEEPIGITTCDILPEVDELKALMADYRDHAPVDYWFPNILAPEDPSELGASAWKPQYYIVPEPGQPKARVLPSHLVVFDPAALRLRFLYRLFDLGYRSRNRPIMWRRAYMLRQVILGLIIQDLRHLLELRLPTLTWDVVRYGILAARRLKEGTVTQAELEDALRHIFVKRRHRKHHPERRIRIPLLAQGMSLARDIDTEEEAQAIGATVA